MGTINDKNDRDLEKRSRRDGKNTWKNGIKKDLNEPNYYNGVISPPEPDIMDCEVK